MELDEEGLVFFPSLELGMDYGFLALIEGLINDIYNVAKFIPRLAKGRLNYKVSRGFLRPHLRAGAPECDLEPGGFCCSSRPRTQASSPSPPPTPRPPPQNRFSPASLASVPWTPAHPQQDTRSVLPPLPGLSLPSVP